MVENVRGDAARQAVDALGGYAYQIYASALAWATLSEGETLHLEIAEDYAISTTQALTAVQVKRTDNAVTSNSSGILQVLESFVHLTRENPERRVTLRYVTTSQIGLEKAAEDRVEGKPFLEAWGALRGSGDLAPLRRRLLAMNLASEARDHYTGLSDAELRRLVLKKVWFDCGQPGFAGLKGQLDDALFEIGVRKSMFASDSKKARPAVIERILNVSCEPGRRELTRAEFARLFEEYTTTPVPTGQLQQLAIAAGSGMNAPGTALIGMLGELMRQPVQPLARHWRALWDFMAARLGRKIWLERSGVSVEHVDTLIRWYPEANSFTSIATGRRMRWGSGPSGTSCSMRAFSSTRQAMTRSQRCSPARSAAARIPSCAAWARGCPR